MQYVQAWRSVFPVFGPAVVASIVAASWTRAVGFAAAIARSAAAVIVLGGRRPNVVVCGRRGTRLINEFRRPIDLLVEAFAGLAVKVGAYEEKPSYHAIECRYLFVNLDEFLIEFGRHPESAQIAIFGPPFRFSS